MPPSAQVRAGDDVLLIYAPRSSSVVKTAIDLSEVRDRGRGGFL